MSTDLLVVGLLQTYLEGAIKANAVLMKAQQEGRSVLKEEFDALRFDDDAARDALAAEIAKQGG